MFVVARRVDSVLQAGFGAMHNLPFGNPFANANKAGDHVLAHGRRALSTEPPMTHSGNRLPVRSIETAARMLEEQGFEVRSGYWG